jgi:hypothetical protein
MTSAFGDPEDFESFMDRNGITPSPGLAQQQIQELAPLLKAEGIDPDALAAGEIDMDPDQLNAALARASEQHNLLLSTPVGDDRTRTLGLLRRYTEATAAGETSRAARMLDAVGPYETDERPAASHVIGVSTGLLDTWYADPELASALGRAKVALPDAQARSAATDILALSRKHRAFDSLQSLTMRYGGQALMDAGAAAVAAGVIAVADGKTSDRTVADVGRDLLLDDDTLADVPDLSDAPPATIPDASAPRDTGRMSRPRTASADLEPEDSLLLRFQAWLGQVPELAPDQAEAEFQMFLTLMSTVDRGSPDPRDPGQFDELLGTVVELEDPDDPTTGETVEAVLVTLFDYTAFQVDTSPHPRPWVAVHDAVDALIDEGMSSPGVPDVLLEGVMEALPKVDEDERRRALAGTHVVAAVRDLLEWIGTRHRVTQNGTVRRGDIQEVSALLGVDAVGVATIPLPEDGSDLDLAKPLPERSPMYAQSMKDVAQLSAWWAALQDAEVIATNTTSVRPGPAAERWLAEDMPPADLASSVVTGFTIGILRDGLDRPAYYGESIAVVDASARLLAAIVPERVEIPPPRNHTPSALQKLARLEAQGLLILEDDALPVIPDPLASALSLGALLTLGALPDEDA